ncbi:nuclear transport factor 2 family protein [Nocardia sp. NPDC052112]|uniref:nuclear transport factor 2 family protein n=1 Tax=Nocardia sp. NPDC052112 TaxID=3155646 RepID=UPI003436F930
MPTPHPTDPEFREAYGRAWSAPDPASLVAFFAPDGTYSDVARSDEYTGHPAIARFHGFMLRFAPDSVIEFDTCHASAGRIYAEWIWYGTFSGSLQLPNGTLADANGREFRVPGIAACTYRQDGKLTSHRDFWDFATVLHQAGVPIGAR